MERYWYRTSLHFVTWVLLPLSWIFHAVVTLRKKLYQIHLKKIIHFPVPIIVVGNITVGGTGKTPVVIWLAKLLREKGFNPGIVSRGVGGRQSTRPRWITPQSDPRNVGDEAILLAEKSQCPVVIGIDRVAAVQELLEKTACDVVLSDDGLQHYRLGRDLEIAVVDGARGLGNNHFLPAGPLRESAQRLKEVDFVIEQVAELGKHTSTFLPMQLQGEELVSIVNPLHKIMLHSLQGAKVHAVAAIGNPQRFFSALRRQGLIIIEHVFSDHYLYEKSDFQFNDHIPIVMTEKDAVKCRKLADERFWFLPVDMKINAEFAAAFLGLLNGKKVTNKLTKFFVN